MSQPDDDRAAPSRTTVPGSGRLAAVLVLAAGAGTRMKSAFPKVLHPIAGRPLISHALLAAAALEPDELVAVIGHGRDRVAEFLTANHPDVRQVVQLDQRGTGHAVAVALGNRRPTGTVVVTYGDTPLLSTRTLRSLLAAHHAEGNAVTVLTAVVGDPHGYGRIVRDGGQVAAIVEHKDATSAQQTINEINSGVYAFDGSLLADMLPRLSPANVQGELYLTDVIGLARGEGHRVGAVAASDPVETEGVNDRVQLARLARVLNDRLIEAAQRAGVTVMDPATTWMHADVVVGRDTVLHPGSSLEAGTVVGENAVIGPDTTLSGCQVGDGATVLRSHCVGAQIGPRASVGPYTYLRPGAVLEEKAKAGGYVEIKNSVLRRGAKVPHLSYVGDAEIGAGSNIGAGVITANYDGVTKSRTVVGENAFVGTDSTLVAPVTIGDGAYVAAGSTVTDDVAPGDLGIARGRQTAISGWVFRKRAETASAASARKAAEPDPVVSGDPDGPVGTKQEDRRA